MANEHLTIKQSTISGRGLFATRDIAKDELIYCISNPIIKTPEDAEKAGFPSDSVIFLSCKLKNKRINTTIFDATWNDPTKDGPLWYYMNHAAMESNCRAEATATSSGQATVCWKAKKPIQKNDELTFNYQIGKNLRW